MRVGFRDTHHINNTVATTPATLHTDIHDAHTRFARLPLMMMIVMISTPRAAAPGRPGRPARELVWRNSSTVTSHEPRSDLGRVPSHSIMRIGTSVERSAAALFKRVGTRCTRRDTEKDCHGRMDWERGRWRLLAPLARQRSV